METIIQDASKGSPIMAYGSASSSPKQKIIRIAAIAFLVIAIPVLIITAIFFTGSAQFPPSILLSISLSPSHINQKINGALLTELPSPWRSALETNTSFPVIIGLAKTETGEPAPFAIVPRNVSISAPEHTKVVKSGLFKTILSDSLTTTKIPYRSFMGILHARNQADVGFMITSRLLAMVSGDRTVDVKDVTAIYGSMTGSRGSIFLPTENIKSDSEPGAFFVILGKQTDQASILSEALLSQGISVRDLKTPERASLKGDGTIKVSWAELDQSGQALLAIAEGKATGTSFELPDKDTVKQIVPEQGYASDTSNELSIQTGWKESSGEVVSWQSKCPGDVRFMVNGEALQNLLTLFRASPSWREKIQSFAISSDQGKNIFCVNE